MSATELPSSFSDLIAPQTDPAPAPLVADPGKRAKGGRGRGRSRGSDDARPARSRRSRGGEPAAPVEQTLPTELLPTAGPEAPAEADGKRGSRGKRGGGIGLTSRSTPRTEELAIAAYPIAHLLPPEVVASGKVRTTRNLMCLLVVAVLVLAGAGVVGAHMYAQNAQSQLDAVQGQTGSVLAQETKYAPVRTDQGKVKLAQAAQHVGAAGEIDWTPYFAKVEALLPTGVTISDISGQTASATTAVTQDTAPLSAGRAAVVTLTVTAPDATTIANAADALQKLPGFAGDVIGALTESSGSGASAGSSSTGSAPATPAGPTGWSSTITISLTQAAFSGRFAAPAASAATGAAPTSATPTN